MKAKKSRNTIIGKEASIQKRDTFTYVLYSCAMPFYENSRCAIMDTVHDYMIYDLFLCVRVSTLSLPLLLSLGLLSSKLCDAWCAGWHMG